MDNKKMPITQAIEVGGKPMTFEVGRFAEQTAAAVLGRYGDTMILATVVGAKPREDLDYFPLQVEYQEKLYAGGRIKGSRWVKREGRPSDDAILNARLVDRSIRPLFPEGLKREVQVVLTVLSVDAENDPDILAINTASAALAISDIPWEGSIAALRLGFVPTFRNNGAGQTEEKDQSSAQKEIDPKPQVHTTKAGYVLVNPTYLEREYSDVDLVVSQTKNNIVMLEAGANEIPEASLIDALTLAQEDARKILSAITELVAKVGKKKLPFSPPHPDPQLVNTVKKESQHLLRSLEKPAPGSQEPDTQTQVEAIAAAYPQFNKNEIRDVLFRAVKDTLRAKILKTGTRLDGRKLDEIRPITIEVDLLPRTHGSAMFKRGQTQALTITTLAAPSLEQWLETMEGEGTKRYMHHYYMPPYSTGEVGRFGWPSRREVGHGALAERALEPMIPSEEEFPYTIRVVSEILSSNGSTSMASVCGSTLSLMAAGVPLKKPVAGISIGLVTGEGGGKQKDTSALLTDIMGLEDHIGDMDFKIAGTRDGMTAIQMDIKIKGISIPLIKEVLKKAHSARLTILERMLAVLPVSRAQLSQYAPKVEVVKIDKEQIGDVIGPGGRVIRQIIAETGAAIDVNDEGKVTISGTDPEAIHKAADWVRNLTRKVQVGEEYDGVVKRIEPFGVFVEILPGKDGLVHVSKLSAQYVSDPAQIVALGDTLHVKVEKIDELGRLSLAVPGVHREPSQEHNRWQKPRPFRPRPRRGR